MRCVGSWRKAARVAIDWRMTDFSLTPRSSSGVPKRAGDRTNAAVWWGVGGTSHYRLGSGGDEMFFGAGRSHSGGEDASRGHFKVRYQTLGPMARVFKLLEFNEPRPRGPGGMGPLQGLNGGLFIRAENVDPHRLQGGGLGIQRAHGGHLSVKLLRGLGAVIVEPVPGQMRSDVRFFLKNVRLSGVKCARRCRAYTLHRLIRAGSIGSQAGRRPGETHRPRP